MEWRSFEILCFDFGDLLNHIFVELCNMAIRLWLPVAVVDSLWCALTFDTQRYAHDMAIRLWLPVEHCNMAIRLWLPVAVA